MPWNTQGGGSGGGGNRGPWGQGPWDQGPQRPPGGGPRGGGNMPPDLDELLRRFQDRLRNSIPGGRGSWLLPILLVLGLVVYNSVYQVQADERGVVLRFGAYSRTVGPGLHFAVWPIENMLKPKVDAENQVDFGVNENEGLMLAGDQNIVDMRFSVLWRIADPEDYLFNVQDPQEAMVRAVAESAMREVVGRTPAEEIRTVGRQAAQDQVKQITQSTLDSYGAGITITAVNLEKADPPRQVIAAFEEVQRAEQNQAQLINEADQYTNQRLRSADGESAKLIEEAKAYKSRVVNEAQGEAQRFLSIYQQYKNAKDVTRERIFLETMEEILGSSNKVIMENGGSGQGVVPYLPLPALQNRAGQPTSATGGQ